MGRRPKDDRCGRCNDSADRIRPIWPGQEEIMTATQAATGRVETEPRSGIRPFDIGRDLRPVAELIADAFALELDPRGAAALREMRIMSYIGGFLKLLNRTTGEFNDVFNGFVWVEDGKVVGNITVQRADRYGSRWQIANVAVAPSYRGQGIARRLMEQGLTHIRTSGGNWAVLQVYAANAAARHLYDSMNFEHVGGISELQLPGKRLAELGADSPPEIPHLTAFSANQWQELYELANHQLTPQAQWWRAIRRGDFQVALERQAGEWLSRNLGRQRLFRRAIQISQRFEAAFILTARRWRGTHKLEIWVRPENYGLYEEAIFGWVFARLRDYPRWPVDLSLPTGHRAGFQVAEEAGFQVRRTLLTMRLRVNE